MVHPTRLFGPRQSPVPRRFFAACVATAALAFGAAAARAQVGGGYSLVVSLGSGQGSPKVSYAPLVQDAAGNFYGTARRGGRAGTVFSLAPTGTLSRFYQFQGGDGAVPAAGLLRDAAGNFYGTTEQGGLYGYGTVFRLTPAGARTVLHDFGQGDDGINPEGALVFGPDGLLYGTASAGGLYGYGTVFALAADGGGYVIDYDFGGSRDDAATPNAALFLGTDGLLYGTTTYGGYHDDGTVFRLSAAGDLTILHDFSGLDGTYPDASLLQANDGNFYGVTSGGGTYDAGTVFRLRPDGALTTLYEFPDKADGLQPEAPLIQATDGLLYGTTYYGGDAGGGTVFALPIDGIALDGTAFRTLHSFVGGDNDGANPIAAVLQATDGTLYGTTAYGGTKRVGTIYRLALNLPPVSAIPAVTAIPGGFATAEFGVRKARFRLDRTGGDLSQPLTVTYTLGGTAVNGVDYQALSGVVTIPTGAARAKVRIFPLVAETTTKTVTLTLSSPADGAYTLGTSQGGTVEIVP